jgi:hypothetical protein
VARPHREGRLDDTCVVAGVRVPRGALAGATAFAAARRERDAFANATGTTSK